MVTFQFSTQQNDFDGEPITLAMQGTPPDVWHKPAPKSSIRKEEATKLITEHPRRFRGRGQRGLSSLKMKRGVYGFVDWCCPLDGVERDDEIGITQYQMPVSLSEKGQATFSASQTVDLETGDYFVPRVRRDIDGDGVKEVFWSGCYDYWIHEDKEFIRNTGDCCGC